MTQEKIRFIKEGKPDDDFFLDVNKIGKNFLDTNKINKGENNGRR